MSSLKATQLQLEKLFSRIQRFHDEIKDLKSNNAEDFLVRTAKIDEHFADFENYAQKLWEFSMQDAKSEADEKLCSDSYKQKCKAYEDLYYIVAQAVQRCKKAVKSSETAESLRASSEVRLPKIDLKTFDGTRKQWQVFYENFKSLIHDKKSLSGLQKLTYLSSVLKGHAESYVKNVPITEANYAIVWKNLVDHYQDIRALGSDLLDTMLTYPPMQTANTTSLNNLIHSLNDSVEALKNLKFEKLDDFILLNIGLKKLPFHVRRLFENEVKGADVPTFKEFMDFLRKQAKIAELTQTSNKDEKPKTQPPKTKVYLNSNSKNRDCPVCEGSHSIYACEEFKRFPVHARIERVKSLKRCRRCLGTHKDECRSKFACKECNQKTHHTLLHSNKTSSSNSAFTQHGSTSEENFDDQKSSSMLTNLQATSTDHQDYTALLGTALIAVKDINGKYQHMRVILDSGAMSSFVSADCAKRLGLPLLPDNTCISGLADSQVNSLGAIDCLVKPRQTDEPKLMVRTIVIPVITENLPCVKISDKVRKFWSKLDLADPSFDDTNAKIDMRLGSEVFVRIISSQKKITKDLGHALQSIYGWVLMGKVPTEKRPKKQTTFIMTENGENSLKEVLTKFWETEEPCHTSPISPEDEKCEALYKELHYRESSGQYVVPLLLKVPNPVLTGSYNLAKKRLNSVQTRLKKLPEVHKKYKDFMEEYENLQHMRPADVHGQAKYYIPHHLVIKETSLTTKLRVVFDASMPTTTGLSLNQVLYTGPKLQASIIDLVIKFRSHRVAFKTDLCKMFRQILIRPEDRQFQHILWQPTDDGPVMDYELLTVTYGTGSAPFLANRTLKQLVLDENKDFSEAACRVVDEDTYVDDSLSGADSIPEVIELRDELYQLLSRGHFYPRQWASSHPEALAGLPEADIALPSESVSFDKYAENSLGVLGLKWTPMTDTFSYNKVEFNFKTTKRTILSDIARIFDPLGWVTPCVLLEKLIIQVLWTLGVGWDDKVPDDIADSWRCISSQFHLLTDLKIPRLIFNPDEKTVMLIGFSDASQRAYAAAVYVRIPLKTGFDCNLVVAKSKVGPMKPQSIPRMELSGADLLAKILPTVVSAVKSTKYKIEKIIALTDSTTVLSWITTHPFKLKTFVANRVVNITENIPADSWFHVATEDNSADIPSRGMLPQHLVNNTKWWKGPSWLTLPEREWPISDISKIRIADVPELKPDVKIFVNSAKLPDLHDVICKISSLTRLQRTIAWVIRFTVNARGKTKLTGPLTAEELKQSLFKILKEVQNHAISTEIELIKEQKSVKYFASLNPFLDPQGILRVGGRLSHSTLDYDTKHPVILPSKGHFTELIIRHFHLMHLHAGPKLLQSIISHHFWIISARNIIFDQSYINVLDVSKINLII
nr:PREDICTED: uncharacterized protein LOC109036879 [Bemisia tabaci]